MKMSIVNTYFNRDEMVNVAEVDYEAAEDYMETVIDGNGVDKDYPDVEDGGWQEQYVDIVTERLASKTDKELAADFEEILDVMERITSNLLLIQKKLEHKKLLLTTHS